MEFVWSHDIAEYGPSHRATIHLIKLARVYALIDSRDYIVLDDETVIAVIVIGQRVFVREEYAT